MNNKQQNRIYACAWHWLKFKIFISDKASKLRKCSINLDSKITWCEMKAIKFDSIKSIEIPRKSRLRETIPCYLYSMNIFRFVTLVFVCYLDGFVWVNTCKIHTKYLSKFHFVFSTPSINTTFDLCICHETVQRPYCCICSIVPCSVCFAYMHCVRFINTHK